MQQACSLSGECNDAVWQPQRLLCVSLTGSKLLCPYSSLVSSKLSAQLFPAVPSCWTMTMGLRACRVSRAWRLSCWGRWWLRRGQSWRKPRSGCCCRSLLTHASCRTCRTASSSSSRWRLTHMNRVLAGLAVGWIFADWLHQDSHKVPVKANAICSLDDDKPCCVVNGQDSEAVVFPSCSVFMTLLLS